MRRVQAKNSLTMENLLFFKSLSEGVLPLIVVIVCGGLLFYILWRVISFFVKAKKYIQLEVEPKKPLLTDYESYKHDSNLLVNSVNNRLCVRIITHKNPDIRTFATSLPHRFTVGQVNKIKEEILEIMQCGVSEYELTIYKSPAADFSDFSDLILKKIFQQLHDVYVQEHLGEDKNKILTPKNVILRKISGDEKLMIEALDGKAYILDAKETFESGIDENFKNWGLNQPGPATAETLLDVSEMTSDGTFVQIFTGITPDLEKLVMTQAQIIYFCEKHRNWLRLKGRATFFLTKVGGKYFVVYVIVRLDGLAVLVNRLWYDHVWDGESRRRVVYPQLISLAE